MRIKSSLISEEGSSGPLQLQVSLAMRSAEDEVVYEFTPDPTPVGFAALLPSFLGIGSGGRKQDCSNQPLEKQRKTR